MAGRVKFLEILEHSRDAKLDVTHFNIKFFRSFSSSESSRWLSSVQHRHPKIDRVSVVENVLLSSRSHAYVTDHTNSSESIINSHNRIIQNRCIHVTPFSQIRTRRFSLSAFSQHAKSFMPKFQFSWLGARYSSTQILPEGRENHAAELVEPGVQTYQSSKSTKSLGGISGSHPGYREAVRLQIEAFWRRNYLIIVGALGLGVCLLLWRLMFGIANVFVHLSEGIAKFGFLALAAAMVICMVAYLKARHTIKPDIAYRIAMRKLNTSPEVLKLLGAPLLGTNLRAYVMYGGGLKLKRFKPRLSNKRCFLIFPVQGSERRGLVSLEIKKRHGKYDFKLLAVDVPTAGVDQRIYLIGDEAEYKVGGGLILELRDPVVKAMAAQPEFEADDEREEDEEHKLLEK